MTPTARHLLLMHAALDGEASSEELQELDRLLAADAEARAEYDTLRRLFGALQALPEIDPPPGLAESATESGQLRLSRRVVVSGSDTGSDALALRSTTGKPRGKFMTGKPSKYVILGGGLVAAALVLFIGPRMFKVPSRDEAIGTVVPAERYRAKQIEASDVKLGDQAVTQLMQTESFERIIKDPQMRALAVDPGFIALARNPAALAALARSPDAVSALARSPDAVAALARSPDAMAALARSPDAMSALARAPEAMSALARSPEAMSALARAPEAMSALARSPEAMAVLARAPEAMSALARSPDAVAALARAPEAMQALARNPQAFSAMARDPGFAGLATNPAFALALARAPNAVPAETK